MSRMYCKQIFMSRWRPADYGGLHSRGAVGKRQADHDANRARIRAIAADLARRANGGGAVPDAGSPAPVAERVVAVGVTSESLQAYPHGGRP